MGESFRFKVSSLKLGSLLVELENGDFAAQALSHGGELADQDGVGDIPGCEVFETQCC